MNHSPSLPTCLRQQLELSSWHLPACTATALLERCTRLQCLRLRVRQLPHGAFAAILDLPGLTELALRCTMPLGPQTADLTRLSGLRVLRLVQMNTAQTPLLPPDLALLPCLELYQLLNTRGPIPVRLIPPACCWLAAAAALVCAALVCCPRTSAAASSHPAAALHMA